MPPVNPQPTPQDIQKLVDLYKQVDNLTDQQAKNLAAADVQAGVLYKQIIRLRDELQSVNATFSSMAKSLKDSVQEFSKTNSAVSSIKKSFASLQSISSKFLSDQSGYSKLTEKEIKKLKEKVLLETQNLKLNLRAPGLTRDQKRELNGVIGEMANFVSLLDNRLKEEEEYQKSIGITGNLLKGLSKIPGIGSALDTEKALEDMRDFAEELKRDGKDINNFENKLKIAGKGFATAFGGLKKSLTDPVSILTFIVTQALKANNQSVQLGKALGFGADKANKFRENLADIARFSTNINITTENLVESFNELSVSTGLVANYSEDTLKTQIMLTKQFGLTGEEAAGIYKYSVLTGKSSSQVNDNMVGAFVAARNSLKVGANFKQVMAEAAKVSGQLAMNFKNNPEAITKAIVQAKALGTTLEDAKSQGEKLLEFGSSLESELKAELLTGQQMNLERARAAALMGDQATVMKELANQGMTLEKFQNMNVLAQQAFAEALGTSADKLSDQLRQQKLAKESGKSLAQITKEEALEAEKRQSIQDKFNAAILKLQDFFGNLLAGPVGQLLEAFTKIVGLITNVLQPVLAVVFTPIKWAVDTLSKMEGLLRTILVIYAGIKAIQITSNALEALKTAQLATQGDLMAMQSIWEEKSIVKKGIYNALAFKDLVIEGAIAAKQGVIAAFEKAKLGYQIGQRGAALGYNSILLARQAIMSSELAKAVGIAAAWAIANPIQALVGLGVAAAAGVLIYSLVKPAGDMISPADGKTQVSTKEGGLFELSKNDDLVAGPGLAKAAKGGKSETISPNIDLTPMITAINQVKASVDRLYSKDQSINMDGKKVGTTLTQKSYKSA